MGGIGDQAPEQQAVKVTLLTQAECAFCEDAKAVLDRLSREYPLRVVTEDMDSPAGQALAARGGIMFAPGVFVEDEPFSYGRLSERKLRRALAKRET